MSDDAAKSDGETGGSDEQLALLREIRDLQKEAVEAQKAHMWILLPIFALLAILLILGLAGFF